MVKYQPLTKDEVSLHACGGSDCMAATLEKSISPEIDSYRKALEIEMIKLGADEQALNLIKDATIRNAIRRNRKPGDVAWALLQ